MSNKIEVSVCCYAYNHSKYIKKALDSFVNQKTNFSFEIVIHDDCSTDGTDLIIKEYQEKYPNLIKPIFEKENKYSKNHNIFSEICLPVIKGKYIAFCEGDDYWTDNTKLQKQYDALEKNPSAFLCCHKTKCTNEDDSYNNTIYPSSKININKSQMISSSLGTKLYFSDVGFFLHFSSYFINKKIFESTSIYYKLSDFYNDDTNMFLTSLFYGNVYYINEIMSNRRLLTINNWNNTFKKLPLKDKLNYNKKVIEATAFYNELTEHKYHQYICFSIYNRRIKIYEKYDKTIDLKFLEAFNINFPFFYSIKFDIKYLLFIISPKLYITIINLFRKK